MTAKKPFTHFVRLSSLSLPPCNNILQENISLDDYPPPSYRPPYPAHHDRPFTPPPAVVARAAPITTRRSFGDRFCHGFNVIFGAIVICAIIFGVAYGFIRFENRDGGKHNTADTLPLTPPPA